MRLVMIGLLAIALTSAAAYAHTNRTPAEIKAMLDVGGDLLVVDVREASEYCDSISQPPGHIIGAVNMPWNSGYLQAHYGELDPGRTTIVVCRSGGRSNAAANFLDGVGFTSVFDMLGGMSAWLWETQNCFPASVPGSGAGSPSALALGLPVPNPFGSETEIAFAVPAGSSPTRVTLGIYDCRGRLVRQIVDSETGPGVNRATWNGRDSSGRPVASGTYFCRLSWNGESRMSQAILLR